jgi:hypothetical protein
MLASEGPPVNDVSADEEFARLLAEELNMDTPQQDRTRVVAPDTSRDEEIARMYLDHIQKNITSPTAADLANFSGLGGGQTGVRSGR